MSRAVIRQAIRGRYNKRVEDTQDKGKGREGEGHQKIPAKYGILLIYFTTFEWESPGITNKISYVISPWWMDFCSGCYLPGSKRRKFYLFRAISPFECKSGSFGEAIESIRQLEHKDHGGVKRGKTCKQVFFGY